MLKGRLPLVIAAVLAILAGTFAWLSVQKEKASVRRGWVLKPVVVASRNIPEGTTLDLDMIEQKMIPEQFVTGSVVKPDSTNYVVGQKVIVQLQKNDPLLWSNFESTKGFEKLSTVVLRRFRAINIPVTENQSVGGWVRPNDHVDVLGTFRNPDTRELETITLMQNILVLATGKITGSTNINLVPENQRKYSTVSILVLPEEAEIVALAGEMGKLSMSLRNPEDIQVDGERTRATLNTLITGERTKKLQATRARFIEVLKGQETSKTSAGVE